MAGESTTVTRVKPPVSFGWYIGVLIAILIIIIVAAYVDIRMHNTQFDKNKKLLSPISNQSTNPLINLPVDSTKTHKINDEDLKRFNAHIQYLSEKVENEVRRTQENSQYDIDRINTFLAIGIGLLAIIGGLLPIFVNFFSKENLEKQMDVFEKTCDGLGEAAKLAKDDAKKAKEDAEKAKEKADQVAIEVTEAKGSLTALTNKLEPLNQDVNDIKEATKKMPYIDMLVLQNAVAKITSADALKLFIGTERIRWIENYLNNLIQAIGNFTKNGIHSIEYYNAEHLKDFFSIISELKTALLVGPIRRIPDGRSFQLKIDEVISNLDKLDKKDKAKCKTELETISKLLTELKELVSQKVEA